MSRVGDASNHTSNGVTPESNSQSAVASSHSVVGESATKKLKFNGYGLPIGPISGKASTRLGHLARTNIPICFNSSPTVHKRFKDQLWNAYKGEYPDVKDSQRDILMGKACVAWKKYKGKLLANLEGDDIRKWNQKVPPNIRSEDWEKYYDHEATQDQKDLRNTQQSYKSKLREKEHSQYGS